MGIFTKKGLPAQSSGKGKAAAGAKVISMAKSEGVKGLQKEVELLGAQIPLSSKFLGKAIKLPSPGRFQMRKAKKVDLDNLRAMIMKTAGRKGNFTCVHDLEGYLEQYPFFPEFHAINAIRLYNELLSIPAEKPEKLAKAQEALLEMGSALFNGADSIFNFHWFAAIYQTYLVLLLDRFTRLKKQAGISMQDDKFELTVRINTYETLIRELHAAPGGLLGIKKLIEMFRANQVLFCPMTTPAVKEACQLMIKQVPRGRVKAIKEVPVRAEHLIFILFVELNLCSSMPLLWPWAAEAMRYISEDNKELALQKKQVVGLMMSLDFQLMLAQSDHKGARKKSDELFNFYRRTAEEDLDQMRLTRQFEADPFIRTAWVVKNSHHLHPPDVMLPRIKKAKDLLHAVIGPRGAVPSLEITATNLNFEMARLLSNLQGVK